LWITILLCTTLVNPYGEIEFEFKTNKQMEKNVSMFTKVKVINIRHVYTEFKGVHCHESNCLLHG
jgi:hypothetical protein